MGRRPCCSKDEGLNKGAWTAMEDKILTDYIKVHGEGKWRNLPKKAGLKRCGKSCRLRWLNYLRPDIKRGNITHDEEELIVRLHKLLGNRWSLIAGRLPGRTDNEIKNYWNTNIGKRSVTQITSPTSSHKPSNQPKEKANWETKRLDDLPPANTEPYVVRTKATRCTKVFIRPEPQINNAEIGTSNLVGVGPASSSMVQQDLALEHKDNHLEPLLPFMKSGEDNLLDFMIDIEMDDRFLSDLLDTDFSQLCGFDDGIQEDNKNTSTRDHGSLLSSPNSDPTFLLSEENLHDPDLQSMASLLDSGINWF